MENNTTQYDKRLSEYRDRMLQRNKEMTADDDDIIDSIINASEEKKEDNKPQAVFSEPVRVKPPVSESYKEYSDKLEAVLRDVGTDKKPTSEKASSVKVTPEKTSPEKASPEITATKHVVQTRDDDEYDEAYDDEEYDEEETSRTAGEFFEGVKNGAHRVASGLKAYVNDKKNEHGDIKRPLSATFKWLIAVAVLLIVFIIVTICYVSANKTYKYNQMDIRPIDSEDLIVNDGVEEETKGYTTIALYGVDSRDSNLNTGTNSDAIIIVSINNKTKEVKLVSVYRDTLVEIQNDSETTQKVNYAYQLGGSLMSVNTLNANFDLMITDYLTVDFSAMADIIDALGGVEVTVTEEELNNLNKNLAEQISISGVYSDGVHDAGTQVLNGQQAVAYSRIRSTGQGDITRTERQRNILKALFETVSSAGKGVIDDLIDVSFDCISTSFTKDEITDLVADVSDYEITDTTGFPFSYEPVSLGDKGSVIVAADLSANVSALHEYLYGNASYAVSSEVSGISGLLTSETGVAASGEIDITANDEASGIETDESSDNESDVNTITSPPDGTIMDE